MMAPASLRAIASLSQFLEARVGQQLSPDRAWRVETLLRPVLAMRNLPTLSALVAALPNDGALGDDVIAALLNHETSFFRDAGVIEGAMAALREQAGARRPRVWCAACATGQEPLSVAMLLAEDQVRADIVATDVSGEAIRRAREGTYSQFEIQRGLPIRRMMRWFEGAGEQWQASAELLSAITYRRQNLAADPAPPGQFDLILCRNVLYYLAPAARERVLARLAEALRPGGLLLLGAGETVIGISERFRPSTRWRGLYELATAAERSPVYNAA